MPWDRSTKAEVRYNPANWDDSDHLKPLEDDANAWNAAKLTSDGTRPTNELVDWTGGFAPPPVEWSNRPQFSPAELVEMVQNWRAVVHKATQNSAAGGDFRTPQKVLLDFGNVICPTEWAFEDISGVPIAECWKQNLAWVQQHDPRSVLDGSSKVEPFWRRFVGPHRELIQPPNVPDDVCDPDDEMSKHHKDQTAEASAQERSAIMMEKREKKRAKRAQLNRFRAEQKIAPGAITDHTPQVNMYIRPVEERDVVQLAEIMNYNILETVSVPEVGRLNSNMMNERRLDVQDGLLPFLVAVERSAKGGRRQGIVNVDPRQELVIGMAFADDYSDRRNMFRYTVEIECYVRKEYMRKKVGNALMDKILGILDPHFAGLGGYDYLGQEEGEKRVVKNIFANVHIDSEDQAKKSWCGEWLNRLGFEKKGEFVGNGRKLGKIVDTYMFWKVTGSHVPSNPR